MSQWKQNDQSVTVTTSTTAETTIGAPIGTYALVKGSGSTASPVSMDSNAHFGNTSSGSRASVDLAMYGNTTVGAFIPNMAVGVFGINATALAPSTAGGGITLGKIINSGSGYAANATVTLTATNGGTSAVANTTAVSGHITTLAVQTAGSGYITSPTVALSAPAALSVSANSLGVNTAGSTLLLASASSLFQAGDQLFYRVPTSNTTIPGLTSNTTYYVTFSNSTALTLSTTSGGANLVLVANGTTTETHSLIGTTATGYFDVASAYPQVTHAGWVVRREGTGGRAGRVQYETLVAMGSLGINGTTGTGSYGTASVTQSNTQNATIV